MLLTISLYDEHHRRALSRFGNDALWAFTPVAFGSLAYPVTVREENELIRFVDPMKEAISRQVGSEDIFLRQYSLRTRFSGAEAELMRRVRALAADFSEKAFGLAQHPINSIISAVGLFRVISAIQASYPGRRLRILEMGPGTGYLGAFLITAGYEYTGIEATQGFYLWQNRFWSHVVGDSLVEQATVPAGEQPLAQDRYTHVPWWHFLEEMKQSRLTADIIVCEQAISEMHNFGSRFAIAASRNILANSPVQIFVFSGPGYQYTSFAKIESDFGEFGFHRILSKNVYAYTPGAKSFPRGVYDLDVDIPFYGLSAGEALLSAPEILKSRMRDLPYDYDFRQFIGLWSHHDKYVVRD